MTLVADIINDAFRQGNLIAVGGSATSLQTAEALRYLRRIVLSVFGAEVGDPLTALYLNETAVTDMVIPRNTRLILNLEAPLEVDLFPMPNAGSRLAIKDISGSLSSNPLTLNGNGRQIQGSASLVISEDLVNSEWFYRDDIADWVLITPLLAEAEFPFPEEFDDFFITMLAIRLNPAYGVGLDEQSNLALTRAKTQLRARYKQNIPVSPQPGTYRLSRNTRLDNYFDGDIADRDI